MSEKKYYTESQIVDILTIGVKDLGLYQQLLGMLEKETPATLPTKVIASITLNEEQIKEAVANAVIQLTEDCKSCEYHGSHLGVFNCVGCKHAFPSHYKAKGEQ